MINSQFVYDTALLEFTKAITLPGLCWPYNRIKDKYWLLPRHPWLKTAIEILVYIYALLV